MRCRVPFVLVVLLTSLLVPMATPAPALEDGVVGPAPPVDRPTGDGPNAVGYLYDFIQTSTKSYAVELKVFYPAASASENATPDASGAPYPTIVWLPGACCGVDSYDSELARLSSWGFVIMSIGINWDDVQNCANVSDMEEYLDSLEAENATPASKLWGMVDKEAFGLSGHSSGGGRALMDGAFVERIRAVHVLAAAITSGTVDYIAQFYDDPVHCQVGSEDDTYIGGCRRAFQKIPAVNGISELTGKGHLGPWEDHLLAAFFLLHLGKQDEYATFLYGEEAMQDVLDGRYYLGFKLSAEVFFPPEVHAAVSPTTTAMDEEVAFSGNVSGYWLADHPQSNFTWDLDGDGFDDHADTFDMNISHVFTEPGIYAPFLRYRFGPLTVDAVEGLEIEVTNPPPVAVAGPDIEVEEDEAFQLNASGSHDTESDNDTLEFEWDLGDGSVREYGADPSVEHVYAEAGTYDVTLSVVDRHGATSTSMLEVVVDNVAPSALAMADVQVNEDDLVRLKGTWNDTASDLDLLEFRWDFGDGNWTDWGASPDAAHIYTRDGTYEAVFSVRDDDGTVVNDSVTVGVDNVAPSVGISFPGEGVETMEDEALALRGWAQDTPSDVPSLQVLWEFGDGGDSGWLDLSEGEDIEHHYPDWGTYTIALTTRDDDGEWEKVTVNVTVRNVVPEVTIQEPVRDMSVFEDQSLHFEGVVVDSSSDAGTLDIDWEVDGNILPGLNMDYLFTDAGTYEVVLWATDDDNATDVDKLTVTVFNIAPSLEAMVEPTTVKVGEAITYTVEVEDTPSDLKGLIISWDFDDGETDDAKGGSHVYNEAGVYHVKVRVVDDDGDHDDRTFTIIVNDVKKDGPDGNDDTDDTGLPIEYIGTGILAIAVLMALLLIFARRKGWGKGEGKGGGDDLEGEEDEEEGLPSDEEE